MGFWENEHGEVIWRLWEELNENEKRILPNLKDGDFQFLRQSDVIQACTHIETCVKNGKKKKNKKKN